MRSKACPLLSNDGVRAEETMVPCGSCLGCLLAECRLTRQLGCSVVDTVLVPNPSINGGST